ncbi:MAG: histidine kinase [Bacteroidales bacterium]|jgi:hypothetical protein|nr:histidine kinase [Bacteroidales bacterium]
MKKHKKIRGFVAAVLFSYGIVVLLRWIQDADPFHLPTLIILGTSVLIIVLLINLIVNKMFSSISNMPVVPLKKKLVPSFILFAVFTFFISFTVFFSGMYILYRVEGWDTSQFLTHIFQRQFGGAFLSVTIGVLMAPVAFFYKIWRQAVDREQQLREENLKYKYRTLKTQVNPHFLFNSLNTLSELVYVDAKKADNYIHKLAGIYRYILEHEETDLIPLDEELEFVKQYFELQKERAGNSILLDMDVENASQFNIIPISLQILVENALKHNSASEENPLKICIDNNDGYIIVSNNMQRKSILNDSPGTGLVNLEQRTKLITGREIIRSQENGLFIVKLPVISTSE